MGTAQGLRRCGIIPAGVRRGAREEKTLSNYDYSKRTDAVKIAEKYGLANGSVLGRHTGLADCIARDISELPAADVAEVVPAQWEESDWREYDAQSCETIRYPKAAIVCTNCRYAFKKEALWKRNFCPSCGAKMDGGNDNVSD